MTLVTGPLPVTGPGLDAFAFPDGEVLLIVGDVHGQRDGLAGALEQFGRMPTPGKRRTLVFLGDLIDRGPDNLGALELALGPAAEIANADRVVHLPGNHELLLADTLTVAERNPAALDKSKVAWAWMQNGGMAFLSEAFEKSGRTMPGSSREALAIFCEMLPHPGHDSFLDMVRSWPSHFRLGDVLCVHAGILPKKPQAHTLELSQQEHFPASLHDYGVSDRHWAWIRDKFLAWQGGWPVEGDAGRGTLVFHGHTFPARIDARAPRDADDFASMMSRMATNARVCLDGGAARGRGVAAAMVTARGVRLVFSPARELVAA